MIYNQKKHEKWKEAQEEGRKGCCLVLAQFEHEKRSFLYDTMRFYP
jgi:hypothetical protein